MEALNDLPAEYQSAIETFANACRQSLGADLKAIVLYGSGAEGRLRATSDVNLILVLNAFDTAKINALRDPYRIAFAAVRLQAMFLLESEIESAAHAFPVKFVDILMRRRILCGPDVFAGLKIDSQTARQAARQALLNVQLRMRERYALLGLREEKLALALAQVAGPLRAAAATLLYVEDRPAASPKQALERLCSELAVPDAARLLNKTTEARIKGRLEPGEVMELFPELLTLTEILSAYAAGKTGEQV